MSVLGALAAALGRARRVPRAGFTRLTTKQGPRGYYKGKGAAPTGHHTSKGEREHGGAGRRSRLAALVHACSCLRHLPSWLSLLPCCRRIARSSHWPQNQLCMLLA